MNLSISDSRTKRAISAVLFFLLALLVSDRLLYWLVSSVDNRVFTDRLFRTEFETYIKGKEVNTLIMGTSRTYEGIHPRYFLNTLGEQVHKEAQPGKGPQYNDCFYRFYREKAGIPDIVIYGVDYFTFNIESRNRLLSRFDYRSSIDFLWPGLLLMKHKPQINEFIDSVIAELKRLFEENRDRSAIEEINQIQNYIGVNPRKNRVISRPSGHFKRFRYHRFPGIEGDHFLSLLRLLNRDGVTVLLVILPDHYGTNQSNFQRRAFRRDLNNLAGLFPNVKIYNYNSIEKFPLDREEYFLNGGYGQTNSHLSRKGAKIFNRILLEDIRHHYKRLRSDTGEALPGDGQNSKKKLY